MTETTTKALANAKEAVARGDADCLEKALVELADERDAVTHDRDKAIKLLSRYLTSVHHDELDDETAAFLGGRT